MRYFFGKIFPGIFLCASLCMYVKHPHTPHILTFRYEKGVRLGVKCEGKEGSEA